MGTFRKTEMLEDEIITVRDLTKTFGRFTAVNHIDFTIRQGEILGFLGPNGAGKTTTIKMMTGLLKITSGEVIIKGKSVKKHLARIKTFTGYMSQKFSLYPLLTGYENIEFFGGISGLSRKEIRDAKDKISELIPPAVLRQKVKSIPPGAKQQVALWTCLLPDPEIILLDEPTSGVDPENRRTFWKKIYELKTMGKTILVTTHNLDEAEYADRVLILHHGNIVLSGSPFELLEHSRLPTMEDLFKQVIEKHEKN